MALSDLNIRLILNDKQFSSGLTRAQKSMAKFGKSMQKTGKSMTMNMTAPIALMAATSLKAFDEQAQALNKLNTQIAANGKDVETTSQDYQNFASSLQDVTTVGDETTLGLLQMAETMKSSDPKAAVSGAIGLSKALGVDLNSAIKMSTLAMEGDYNMLQRYVPALKSAGSEAEKAAIVQKLFADGLAIAKTEAETGLGPLKQLSNSFGDFQEQIGGIVSRMLPPLVDGLKSVVSWLQQLSPDAQEMAVKIALVAAAIGPVLLIVGKFIAIGGKMAGVLRTLTGVYAGLNKVMSASTIGLIVAAIALLVAGFVYLAHKVGGVGNAFKLLKAVAMATINTAIDYFATLGNVIFTIGKNIAKTLTAPFKAASQAISGDFDAASETLKESLTSPFEGVGDIVKEGAKNIKGYWTEVSNLKDKMVAEKNAAKDAAKATKEFNKATQATPSTSTQSSGNSGSSGGSGGGRIEMAVIPVMDAKSFEGFDIPSDVTPPAIPVSIEVDPKSMTAAQAQMADFSAAVGNLISDTVGGALTSLGEGIGAAASGEGLKPLFDGVLNTFVGFLGDLGQMLIKLGVAQLALGEALSLGPLGAPIAIAAGVGLVAISKMISAKMSSGSTDAFANGTASAGGGLSLVGERGPELVNMPKGSGVMNASRTAQAMGGGGSQTLTTKLSGNDILIAVQRTQALNKRR